MYSPEFWKAFFTKPDWTSERTKLVITDDFVYQLSVSDNPQLNKVMYIENGDLEEVFTEISELFSEKENGFQVVVRDTDHPNLEQYLLDNDYRLMTTSDNRVFKLTPESVTSIKPEIEIPYEKKELSKDEMYSEDIYQLLKSCFPDQVTSLELHNSVNDAMFGMAEHTGSILRNFALYDGEIPIAFGSLFDHGEFRGVHLANLSGAATHPEYRNQGLYTSILYLRARLAMDDGVDALYIQADKASSSPIVAKYGFEVVEEIREYHSPKS